MCAGPRARRAKCASDGGDSGASSAESICCTVTWGFSQIRCRITSPIFGGNARNVRKKTCCFLDMNGENREPLASVIIMDYCNHVPGFTKLFAGLVHSTVWREDMHVKVVWITLLALADRNGEVLASIPGLADA